MAAKNSDGQILNLWPTGQEGWARNDDHRFLLFNVKSNFIAYVWPWVYFKDKHKSHCSLFFALYLGKWWQHEIKMLHISFFLVKKDGSAKNVNTAKLSKTLKLLWPLNCNTSLTLRGFINLYPSGPPHELNLTEVRSSSLVLLWKTPVYTGRTPVTGFYVDIKEADAPEENWRSVNEQPIPNTYIKVTHSYVFPLTFRFRFSWTLKT